VICIIPARGGSKRIPNKNLKELDGLPILGFTIQQALKSQLFRHVVVSTDDAAIARTSLEFGAQFLMRPAELADDFTSTISVMAHAIYKLKVDSRNLVCCLYPVTPLLDYSRISQALEIIKNEDLNYVFPALPCSPQEQRSFTSDEAGRILKFEPEKSIARTQDLESKYVDAGQFYLGHAETWSSKKAIFSNNSRVIILSQWEVLDVDTLGDWEIMESLYYSRRIASRFMPNEVTSID
jgi:pseudaminic acid cytidylyltransferase